MSFNLPFNSIKEFTINELIHEGPYTLVFRGRQTNLKRDVLIKLLKPSGGDDLKKRFEREARVYARLNHPNIVSVFDFGEKEKYLYIILEYVHGTNLKILLANHKNLPFDIVQEIGCAVLSALEHAAKNNVVHRDVKPANILIDKEGRVKVADFGLAMIGDEPNLTQQQAMVGTPAYMSPEQITGEEIDERSDLFSFAALIYELLFNEQAFGSESYSTCINNILNETPQHLLNIDPEIPQEFLVFIKQCLQKDKDQRFINISTALKEWESIKNDSQESAQNFLTNRVIELSVLGTDKINFEKQGEKKEKAILKKVLVLVVSFTIIIILVWWSYRNVESETPIINTKLDSTIIAKNDPTTHLAKPDSSTKDSMILTADGKNKSTLKTDDKIPAIKIEDEEIKAEKKEILTARLDLVITPWAKVYVDDVLIDSHLVKKQIPVLAGEHVLTFEHPRFETETQVVSFSPNELTQVQWSFWDKTGFLKIEVRPWAHVYINDEFYDTTPVNRPIRIPAGRKILELRHPSLLNHRELIDIKAADTLNLRITLKSNSGTVIDN